MFNAFAVLATATYCNSGEPTTYNKAYALHSLSLVRATPNRGGKAAATSHKQNVVCNAQAWFASSGKESIYLLCVIKVILENIFRLNDFRSI